MTPRVARLRDLPGVAALYALATLLYTWPIARHLGTAYLYPFPDERMLARADSYLTSWMLAWGAHALGTAPWRLFDANIFHPLPLALALSENLVAGAATVLPLARLDPNPVLLHNALFLGTFVVLGAGTAFLARELGVSWPAALAAGAFAAFSPLRVAVLGHLHSLSSHWMPVALLFLHRTLRTGTRSAAIGFGAALALQALSSVYHAYFFAVAVGILLAAHVAVRAPRAPHGLARVLAGGLLAALVVAPTMLPYAAAREIYALARSHGETATFVCRAVSYLGALMQPVAFHVARYVAREPTLPFVGLGVLGLAVAGLGAGRIAVAYATVALALALVSFGPVLAPGVPGPYLLLQHVVPGFEALRVPARAAMPAVLALAVLAAFGADRLLRAVRRRRLALAVLAVVALAESLPPRLWAQRVPWGGEVGGLYAWLAAQPGRDPILELPIGQPDGDARHMVLSAWHWRPLVNGYSGFVPAGPWLRSTFATFPDGPSLRLLRDLAVRWVVVHPATALPRHGALCTRPTGPHLARRYVDALGCVLEVLGAPVAPSRPTHVPVSLVGTTASASNAADAGAALDGDLATHWTAEVGPTTSDWLALTFPAPMRFDRILLRLGSHFGDFPRQYRIETSDDGQRWATVADAPLAEAPLRGMRDAPDDLAVAIDVPGTRARHLRIVRPAAPDHALWDLYAGWSRWGVHEVALFAVEDGS